MRFLMETVDQHWPAGRVPAPWMTGIAVNWPVVRKMKIGLPLPWHGFYWRGCIVVYLVPDPLLEIWILDQLGQDVQHFIFIQEKKAGFAILDAICIGSAIWTDCNDAARRVFYEFPSERPLL